MPCNSDYLEPTHAEIEHRRAAGLLVWFYTKTGRRPPKWAVEEANNIYARNPKVVTELCAEIKALSKDQREAILYNAHDADARRLATWWEEHQEADTKREAKEAEEARLESIAEAALAKLTPEERGALGLAQKKKRR